MDRDRGLAARDADAGAESAVVPLALNVVPVAGLVDADRRPPTVRPGRDHLDRSRIRRLFVKEVATATAVEAVDYVTNNSATIIDRFAVVVQAIEGEPTKPDVTSTLAVAVQGSGIDDAAAVAFLDDPVLNAPAAAARVTVGHPAVRLLNWMEHETATFAVLGRSTEAVKIGTEFTFADKPGTVDSVRKLDIIDSAKRDATQKRVHKKASDTITAWVGKALTGRNLISGNPSIKVAAAKGSGVKAEYAQSVTYTFEAGTPAEWTWYWVADVDMACYETQTQPTSVEQMRGVAIQDIVDKHIVGLAKTLGLTPDVKATGGGGHISLDLSTSVGYTGADGTMMISFEVFLQTLVDLQKGCALLQAEFNKSEVADRGESDVQNAPWLSVQEFKPEFKKLGTVLPAYAELAGSLLNGVMAGNGGSIAAAATQLKDFNEKLTNPLVTNPKRKAQLEAKGDISHYQAVNIEHMDEAEAPKRRIELRDIPAQTSHAKLMKDLATIQRALEATKDRVKQDQSQRLGYLAG